MIEAGRELDAQIDKVVFGRVVEWKMCWQEPECGTWIISDDEELYNYPKHPCYLDDAYWEVCEFYSVDIGDAWKVVEKLDNAITLSFVHGLWRCYAGNGLTEVLGVAKTAPLAICYAALKLKGK